MAHIRRHPRSGRWQVRYRDPSGRERSKTFERKTDATRFAATVTADVVRGDFIDPQAGKTTMGEFALRWQATRSHLAQATRDQDRHYLNSLILPTFGTRAVAGIRRSEVETWLANLNAAPATKGRRCRTGSGAAGGGGRWGDQGEPVRRYPAPFAEPRREGRALTEDDVTAVISAAEQIDESTAGMVWLMARAGLRIGEVLALRRDDLASGSCRFAAR